MYILPTLWKFISLPVYLGDMDYIKKIVKDKNYYMLIKQDNQTNKHVRIVVRANRIIQGGKKEFYKRVLYYAEL